MRLIDADDAREELIATLRDCFNVTYEVVDVVATTINNIPTIDAEPHWIPCEERLPKDNRQVLVYARGARYALAKYDEMMEADGSYKKQWVTFDAWKPLYTIKEVMAWMPLPEPFKGVTE